MGKIALSASLKLHEIVTIPMMTYNCETWIMTQSDVKELEKMELWALKRLLNLPKTTPTAGVRYETKTLFAEIRIDEKQFLYLHKILKRDTSHWTHHMLKILDAHSIGWATQIRRKIHDYGLEESWHMIGTKTDSAWKNEVKTACEKRNIELLKHECQSVRSGSVKDKTKTKSILINLNDENYTRSSESNILKMSKLKARAIIMTRYGMLDCAKNFEGRYGKKECNVCSVIDDENHRVNDCVRWKSVNLYLSTTKADLNLVYSMERDELERIADVVLAIWDLKNGRNSIVGNK